MGLCQAPNRLITITITFTITTTTTVTVFSDLARSAWCLSCMIHSTQLLLMSGHDPGMIVLQEAKSHDKVDMFMLITQVVVARGIHLLVKLAEEQRQGISSAAVATLKHLTATSWRLKSLLQRAARDPGLINAVAAGNAASP